MLSTVLDMLETIDKGNYNQHICSVITLKQFKTGQIKDESHLQSDHTRRAQYSSAKSFWQSDHQQRQPT